MHRRSTSVGGTGRRCSYLSAWWVALGLIAVNLIVRTQRPGQVLAKPAAVKPASAKPAARSKVVSLVGRRRTTPLVSADYLDVTVALVHGRLRVVKIKRGKLARAKLLPRFRGHYRVLLFSGGLVRDQIPFSMPLTLPAGEPSAANRRLDRALRRGVRAANTTVRVPYVNGLTHLEISGGKLRTRTRIPSFKAPSVAPPLPGPRRTDAFGRRKVAR